MSDDTAFVDLAVGSGTDLRGVWIETYSVCGLYGPQVIVQLWDLDEGEPESIDPHIVLAFTNGVLDGQTPVSHPYGATGRFAVESLICLGVLFSELRLWAPLSLSGSYASRHWKRQAE